MAVTGAHTSRRNHVGWRWLGAFWIAALLLTGTGTGVVQWLGPPGAAPLVASADKPADPAQHAALPVEPAQIIVIAGPAPVVPLVAGRDTPGPVADPDPALLEPLSEGSKLNLPRIASDARTPMQVYAAGFDHSSRRPRIGLLLAGIGMNDAESDVAIRSLPGAVSLAVSPYATANAATLTRLLATARATGHEYLIELPLEPAGFPLNDPGPSALLTSAPTSVNAKNLYWALSRIDGYVGATGVIGTMRGERLAGMTDQMDAVLSGLSERGLLYVDPREDRSPTATTSIARTQIFRTWGRHTDLVIDDPADQGSADRTMIDAKLDALEQQAKDSGSALGLVMRPTPVTVARIAAWSNGLTDRGLTLAPVSSLALPPADMPVKLSERE